MTNKYKYIVINTFSGGILGKVPITITVDEETLEEFKKVCEKMDIKVSTKINSLMKYWAQNNHKKAELVK